MRYALSTVWGRPGVTLTQGIAGAGGSMRSRRGGSWVLHQMPSMLLHLLVHGCLAAKTCSQSICCNLGGDVLPWPVDRHIFSAECSQGSSRCQRFWGCSLDSGFGTRPYHDTQQLLHHHLRTARTHEARTLPCCTTATVAVVPCAEYSACALFTGRV